MLEAEAIRELCREIVNEKDPEKSRLLVAELRAMVAVVSDETRLRLRLLARFVSKLEDAERESSSNDEKAKKAA